MEIEYWEGCITIVVGSSSNDMKTLTSYSSRKNCKYELPTRIYDDGRHSHWNLSSLNMLGPLPKKIGSPSGSRRGVDQLLVDHLRYLAITDSFGVKTRKVRHHMIMHIRFRHHSTNRHGIHGLQSWASL